MWHVLLNLNRVSQLGTAKLQKRNRTALYWDCCFYCSYQARACQRQLNAWPMQLDVCISKYADLPYEIEVTT